MKIFCWWFNTVHQWMDKYSFQICFWGALLVGAASKIVRIYWHHSQPVNTLLNWCYWIAFVVVAFLVIPAVVAVFAIFVLNSYAKRRAK